MQKQVSEAALKKRINRQLAKVYEQLHTTRGEMARIDVGDHYIVDQMHNIVTHTHVNLESLGRDLEVLRPGEVVAT